MRQNPYLVTIKYKKPLSIIALLIFSLSLACSEQSTEPKWVTYGPYYFGEAIDYIYFKPGSWWVYRNSKTGERDSIVMMESRLDTVTFNDNYDGQSKNKVIKEWIYLKTKSFVDNYEYRYDMMSPLVWHGMDGSGLENLYVYRHKSRPGNSHGEARCFHTPFTHYGNSENHRVTQDTTVQINNISYSNTVVFSVSTDYTNNRDSVLYYWSKDVGLIMTQNIETGVNQELVSYYIKQ